MSISFQGASQLDHHIMQNIKCLVICSLEIFYSCISDLIQEKNTSLQDEECYM